MEGLTGCDIPDIAYRAIKKAIKANPGKKPKVTSQELAEALDDVKAELKMVAEKGNYTSRGKAQQESRISQALHAIENISESLVKVEPVTEPINESARLKPLLNFMKVYLADDEEEGSLDLDLDAPIKGDIKKKIKSLLGKKASFLRHEDVTQDAIDAARKFIKNNDTTLRDILIALSGDD